MKKLVLLSFALFCIIGVFAQQNLLQKGEIFRDDVVPSVYIAIPQDSLEALLDPANRLSDYHYRATFVFDNGTIRDTLENVGFRLRGNTSRKAAKKSFKISFNTYESGRAYHGLEKMNINGEHNDPSLIRSKLCFDMLNYLEVPASRVNHVKLYINGTYFGLYANVEHIDEEFTHSRYGSKGNLYKCLYGADLAYRGSSPSSYKLDYYELKDPVGATDYADLAHFIDVLNNTADADFECELEKVFNVNMYLKSLVMDVLVGNWDGPNYNKNNFYLYANPTTKQFEYIPFDLDNTLGVDFLGRDWATRDIYTWSKGNSGRPLYDKILTRQSYREKFSYLLQETIDAYFNKDSMSGKIEGLKTLISSAAIEDTIRTLDYGYSISDFNNSFGYFSRDHVKYGLVDYITRREVAARTQLDAVVNVGLLPFAYSYAIDYHTDSITFQLKTKGEFEAEAIELVYNWDAQSAIWRDTMKVLNAESNTYEITLYWPDSKRELAFLFRLRDSEKKVVDFPSCNMFSIQKSRTDLPIYINELMADNTQGARDEEGETEDWIELYYDADKFIDPGVLYLTDDLDNPYKYPLVLGTIAPKSFHLLWADDEESDGRFHTNFKLSKKGEVLALFDAEGVLVDRIVFGAQNADVSFGRKADGGEDWVSFEVPTPRASNDGTINDVPDLRENNYVLYPNPTAGKIKILNVRGDELLKVVNATGVELLEQKISKGDQLDLTPFGIGVYFVILKSGNQTQLKRVVVVD